MPVLDLRPPEGVVRPIVGDERRPPLEPADQRFSSPAAAASNGREDPRTAALAAELATSGRVVALADAMLRKHLAPSADAATDSVVATFVGAKQARVEGPGLVAQARDRDPKVAVALLADPLVVLVVGGDPRLLHWSLLPGGPSVTSRADALRLLRALASGGALTIELGNRAALPPLEFSEAPWEDEHEWRLFEDLAALEEWSGATIPMPAAVSSEEATEVARAATWVRTRQIPARITEAFTFDAADDLATQAPDELRLHREFETRILDVDVPLGEASASIPLRRIERVGSRYRAWPAQSSATFVLRAPASRHLPARRTQPERVTPPDASHARASAPPVHFRRRATRALASVLADRERAGRGTHHPGGTAGLLDEVRGE